uniref:Uncharacterized protein n=1 Tax=Ascaris lumbricoides TaxID=6252 RepID=A0A0M3I010_ASCLU
MKVIPKTSRPFFNDIRFCAATIYIERFRILDSNGTSMFAIKKACNHANRYVPIRGVVCLHVQQRSSCAEINLPMRTDDDSEIEHAVVKQVASVTIESDSQTENGTFSLSRSRRRKKRTSRRGPAEYMDVDIPSTAPLSSSPTANGKKSMDWDGVYSASELSSSETYSSDGREADDEQSDWVDPSDVHINDSHDPHASNGRQQRVPRVHTSLALLQRKLERFVRDDNQRELILYQWIRSHQVYFLQEYHCKLMNWRMRG